MENLDHRNVTMEVLAKPTEILFPSGSLTTEAVVVWSKLHHGEHDTHLHVITTRTPFHPIAHIWPDQPGDIGTLFLGVNDYVIVGSHVAAFNPSNGVLLQDKAITARQSDPDWVYHVVHEIGVGSAQLSDDSFVGNKVTLKVDPVYRAQLARTHTSCHLMSLALNKVVAGYWSKEVKLDSLGNPDFDQLAIQESTMDTVEARDTYRLGKSLRKSGFDSESFLKNLDTIATSIASQVNDWIDQGFDVVIQSDSSTLNGRRYWKALLSGSPAIIPCGGVHVAQSNQLAPVKIIIERSPDQPEIVLRTIPIT
jgi:alanyl-tRNA synthetase